MNDGFVALYIFMLAAIAGHVIISRVPVILHTPLMSGSNFIHGIVLIGAMVVLGHADTTLGKAIGFVAVLLGAGLWAWEKARWKGVAAKAAGFAQAEGLILRSLLGDRIAICPPLIISEEEIGELFDRLTRALDKTAEWVASEGLKAA